MSEVPQSERICEFYSTHSDMFAYAEKGLERSTLIACLLLLLLLLPVSDLVPLLHSLSQRFPNSCGDLTVLENNSSALLFDTQAHLAGFRCRGRERRVKALKGQSASSYLVKHQLQ